jgi:hypothetical protein
MPAVLHKIMLSTMPGLFDHDRCQPPRKLILILADTPITICGEVQAVHRLLVAQLPSRKSVGPPKAYWLLAAPDDVVRLATKNFGHRWFCLIVVHSWLCALEE